MAPEPWISVDPGLDRIDRYNLPEGLAVKEIARRVSLGTSKSANTKLHRFIKNEQQSDAPGNEIGI